MTLIIGKRCEDGVIVASDRRCLRGYEPSEHCKILQMEFEVEQAKGGVLLVGAGVASFWDELALTVPLAIKTDTTAPVKTLLDVISLLSGMSITMSSRYQRGALDEPLGCVVAGLDNLISGRAGMFSFAGAGFSQTEFICLGSGETYALPLADALLNTHSITLEQATRVMPMIFALVERVNLSVNGGPDIFIIGDGEQATQVEKKEVEEYKGKAQSLIEEITGRM